MHFASRVEILAAQIYTNENVRVDSHPGGVYAMD